MKKAWQPRFADFFRREWLPCALVLVLLLARLAALRTLNATYTLYSDDLSYINSGITLAKTGMLTMHDNSVPTGQIMPGMSVLIALFYLVLGEGTALWLGLKLFWIVMGSLTGWFIYHSVRLYAPAWCAGVATLFLLRPDFLWTDNLILTETPTMLCFSVMLYCTLQLARTDRTRYAALGGAAFLLAFLLRANMGVCILFVGAYLLASKLPLKTLLKRGLALGLVLLCFLVPWTVRNYIHFHAFIPISFGAGNPVLLGTYQGRGYPLDEELDYETHVEQVVRERYAAYYNEDGSIPHEYQKYLELQTDAVKASYRQRVWLARSPGSFALSYLAIKPWHIMRGVFYWQRLWDIPHEVLKAGQAGLLWICLAMGISLFARKRNRRELAFLAVLYLGNVWLCALAFALDRYNIVLMPALLVFFGVGLENLAAAFKRLGRKLGLQAP